jgi:uncharacterized protein (DUF2249 family)
LRTLRPHPDTRKLVAMKDEVIELDVRTLHDDAKCRAIIFETWERLNTGQTLRIINDHDPQPLRRRFEVTFPKQFIWEYEQRGPDVWVIRISRQ